MFFKNIKSIDELVKTAAPSVSQLKEKNVGSGALTEEQFQYILDADYTYEDHKNNPKLQDKVGSYIMWLLKVAKNENYFDIYSSDMVKDFLLLYDTAKWNLDIIPENKKDINQVKNVTELKELIEPHKEKDLRSDAKFKQDVKSTLKHPEWFEIIYDGEKSFVVVPKNIEAACFFGSNAQWCTATTNRDNNMFDNYNQHGNIHIIVDKETKEKWQFHKNSDQYMDMTNQPINIALFAIKILNDDLGLREFLKKTYTNTKIFDIEDTDKLYKQAVEGSNEAIRGSISNYEWPPPHLYENAEDPEKVKEEYRQTLKTIMLTEIDTMYEKVPEEYLEEYKWNIPRVKIEIGDVDGLSDEEIIQGSKHLYHNLNKLIRKNNLRMIELAIQQGAQPDNASLSEAFQTRNPDIINLVYKLGGRADSSTFNIALKSNNFKLVELAAQLGVVPTTSSVHKSIESKNPEIVKFVLQQGGQPGPNSLGDALLTENPEIINLILKTNPRINAMALYNAIETNNLDIVKLIVETSMDNIQLKDIPLSNAFNTGNVELVKLIIQTGAQPDYQTLSNAVHTKNLELVNLALQIGAYVDPQSLFYAIEIDNVEILKLLVSKLQNKVHWETLEAAVRANNPEIVKVLLEKRQKRHYLSGDIMRIAIRNENIEMINLLLEAGIELDSAQILTIAVETNNLEIVKFIYKISNWCTNATISAAVKTKNPEIIKFIFEVLPESPMIELSNETEESLLGRGLNEAIQTGDLEIVNLVVQLRGRPNEFTLEIAINTNNSKLVKTVLDLGAEPNEYYLLRALHIENAEILQLVLESGAKPDEKILNTALDMEKPELINLIKKYMPQTQESIPEEETMDEPIQEIEIEDNYDEGITEEDEKTAYIGVNSVKQLIKKAKILTPAEYVIKIVEKFKKENIMGSKGIEFLQLHLIDLFALDPTFKSKDETGSYTVWLYKAFLQNSSIGLDILSDEARQEELKYYLTYYMNNKQNFPEEYRDINNIKSFEQLEDVVVNLSGKKYQLDEEKANDIKIAYDDDTWFVLEPLSHEAAINYGKDTNWCTAASSVASYQNYERWSPLTIIINKKNGEKWQSDPKSGWFKDMRDKEINEYDWIQKYNVPDELSGILQERLQKDVFNNNLRNYIEHSDVDEKHKSNLFKEGGSFLNNVIGGGYLTYFSEEDIINLHEAGAQINDKTLDAAIKSQNKNIIKLVLKLGAKPDSNSLDNSLRTQNTDIIELIADIGAPPSAYSLETAIYSKDQNIIDIIKQTNPPLNDYILERAIRSKDSEILEHVLSLKDFSQNANNRWTLELLKLAIDTENNKIIQLLLHAFEGIVKIPHLSIYLENAIQTNNPEIVKLFIQYGAEVSSYDYNQALRTDNKEIIEIISNELQQQGDFAGKETVDELIEEPEVPEEKTARVNSLDQLIKLSEDDFLLRIAKLGIGYSEDLSDNLAILYEWEYKYHRVLYSDKTNPHRKEKLLETIERELGPVVDVVSDALHHVYHDWLSGHAITDPRAWAEARIDYDRFEGYGPDMAIANVKHEYLGLDGKDFEINFFKTNLPYFKNFFREARNDVINHYYEELDYAETHENEEEIIRFKNDIESLENLDLDNEEDLYTFTNEYYDASELIGEENARHMFETNPNLYNMIIDFLELEVFPLWFAKWEPQGIVDTRERIEKLFEQLQQIEHLPFQKVPGVINQALTASHQTGPMLDYISYHYDVGMDFLNDLSNKGEQEIEKWNKDLVYLGVW